MKRLSALARPVLVAGLFAAGAAAATLLAPASDAASSSTLELTMTAENACAPASLSAPAGEVTIVMRNPLDEWQSFGVVGAGAGSPEKTRRGGTSTLTATLAAGTYTFWCGDDEDDDDAMRGTLTVGGPSPPGSTGQDQPPPGTVSVTANDDFFAPASLSVAAGQVTVNVSNSGGDAHTFTIANVVNAILQPGERRTLTFTLPAGAHTFFCAYHGGMRGTITAVGSGPPPPPPPPPSGGGNGGPPSSSLTVTTRDFSFAPSSLSALAGTVTLTVKNEGQLPHTLTVAGLVDVDVPPGGSKTVTFQASPGTYRFVCTYPGHDGAGMTGTLTVAAAGGQLPPAPGTAPPGASAPAAGTGHQGHGGHAVSSVAVRCPAGSRSVTVAGVLVSATRSKLVLDAKKAVGTPRVYAGKRVSVVRSRSTVIAATGSAVDDGLKAEQRARAKARCAAPRRLAVATRISVSPPLRPPVTTVLGLTADAAGTPKFDKASLDARAGRVTLRLANPSPLPHNVSIDGHSYGKVVQKGGVSVASAKLKPGRYVFFCAVPGHATAGMKGTLVVR